MTCPIYIGIAGWSYPDWRGIVYPSSKTDPLAYVSQYVDNKQELLQIKDRLTRLTDSFGHMVVIGNNHYKGAELANAIELKHLLTGQKQRVPPGLIKAYPRLERIAIVEKTKGQQSFGF